MSTRSRVIALVVGCGTGLAPAFAAAHSGAAGVQTSLAAVPGTLALLGILGVPYAAGLALLWRVAGRGRGIRRWEAASFALGISVLGLALIGPSLAPVTQEFSGHMAQHLLLLGVAAPLLAFGRPGVAYAWALRRLEATSVLSWSHRHSEGVLARWIKQPPVLLLVYVAVVWAWHIPAVYDAAARSEALHTVEHLSLLGVSFAFWYRVRSLALSTARRQVVACLLLFAAMFPELVLGAFIAFARKPLYESHHLATVARGGDPLTDQQFGGFVMLMLGGFVYAGVALAGMLRLLSMPVRETGRGWER